MKLSAEALCAVRRGAPGLGERWPVFSKQYAYVSRTLTDVAQNFMAEVRDGTFVEKVLGLNASRKE